MNITFWSCLSDTTADVEPLSFAELTDAFRTAKPYAGDQDHGGWSPAVFDPPNRAKDNVKSVNALVLDYDADSGATIDAALACWNGTHGFLHTSKSHTTEVHRFRIVLEVSRSMASDEFPIVWRWAERRAADAGHKVDGQTKDAGRFWYTPATLNGNPFEHHEIEGAPVDVDAVLAIFKPSSPATATAPSGEKRRTTDANTLRRARAYLAEMPPSIEHQHGDLALWNAALVLTRGFSLPDEDALTLLRDDFNPRCEPPWPDGRLVYKVKETIAKGEKPWGYLLPKEGDGWHVHGVDEIFAPLEPLAYVVEALDIAPGAPTLVAGYGFSAKTVAVMSLAVQVLLFGIGEPKRIAGLNAVGPLLGPKAWNMFPIQRGGSVLWVDFEQGRRAVFEKFQRFVRCHVDGDPKELLRGRLEVVSLPQTTLDAHGAEEVLVRHATSKALVVIDTLKPAAPTKDENSSEIRQVLDLCTRASEATGAIFVVIHHARKPSRDDKGGAVMAIRGSGAIFDASASVLVFDANKGEAVHVRHVKARNRGVTADDFTLSVEDVPIGGDERAGVRVVGRGLRRADAAIAKDTTALRRKAQLIALTAEKGTIRTKEEAYERLSSRRQKFLGVFDVLIGDGLMTPKPFRLTPVALEQIDETVGVLLKHADEHPQCLEDLRVKLGALGPFVDAAIAKINAVGGNQEVPGLAGSGASTESSPLKGGNSGTFDRTVPGTLGELAGTEGTVPRVECTDVARDGRPDTPSQRPI